MIYPIIFSNHIHIIIHINFNILLTGDNDFPNHDTWVFLICEAFVQRIEFVTYFYSVSFLKICALYK